VCVCVCVCVCVSQKFREKIHMTLCLCLCMNHCRGIGGQNARRSSRGLCHRCPQATVRTQTTYTLTKPKYRRHRRGNRCGCPQALHRADKPAVRLYIPITEICDPIFKVCACVKSKVYKRMLVHTY
jgi:hypothetical protein